MGDWLLRTKWDVRYLSVVKVVVCDKSINERKKSFAMQQQEQQHVVRILRFDLDEGQR
jgi:hypothetical protein